MTSAELSALLVLLGVASFTPGPNTTLSTALGANLGLAKSLHFVLAVPVGWGLLLSVCAAGVGAVVSVWPPLRLTLQALGIGYLLWLAFKLARSGPLSSVNAAQLQLSFGQGVLLQFFNIKAWMFTLAVVAGWLAGRPDAAQRFAIILPLMLAFGFFSNLAYASIGALLRDWLAGPAQSGARLRWFNRCMAGVLLVTATWMSTF